MFRIYIYLYIDTRGLKTAASMKKIPLIYTIFTVFELTEQMGIGLDQSLQHLDRCLLKLGKGNLPIAELPDSIHIPPENHYEIQDDSGIAIGESPRHREDQSPISNLQGTSWRQYLPTLLLQSNCGPLNGRKGNTSIKIQHS